MQLDFNVYSIILLISGIAAALFSVFIFYRLGGTVKWFALTMLNVSIWVFFYGLELASLNFSAMYFWIRIEYIGIAFTPVTWLLFSFKYTDKEAWLNNKWFLLGVFLIPIVTYILVLTNEWHYLYYKSVEISAQGPFPLLAIQKGPWYFIHSFYFYFSILWGNYLLFSNNKQADRIYKDQTYLLVISTSIPLLVNAFYLMGFRIHGHIDITPFAFIVSFLITGLGLVKYNLLEVVPIAKERLIAVMSEGIMVVDENGKVIEMNPSMKKIMGSQQGGYIGVPIQKILEQQNPLLDALEERIRKEIEISVQFRDHLSVYLVEVIPLLG